MEFKYTNSSKIFTVYNHKLDNGSILPLLKYPMLEELNIVNHCFTTRLGGVSKDHLSSLNLSFARGDSPENVKENFRRLAQALETSDENFVFTDQTHTTNIMKVDSSHKGCGLHKTLPYSNIDGLITNESGLVLSTFYADCVPLYFVDPIHHAIGLSHSGWRGTVGRMGLKTLEAMNKEYGTAHSDVYAAIGPSICVNCYEISEDVANEFIKEFPDHISEILIPKENHKYQLDLWKCNEIILLEAGIKKDHLAVTNICSSCNHDLLFSHRKTNGMRGNLGAFMYLK